MCSDINIFDNKIEWLTTKEAAGYLRISPANLRVRVNRGEIPVDGRLGRLLRFRRERLDELLKSQTKGNYNDYKA